MQRALSWGSFVVFLAALGIAATVRFDTRIESAIGDREAMPELHEILEYRRAFSQREPLIVVIRGAERESALQALVAEWRAWPELEVVFGGFQPRDLDWLRDNALALAPALAREWTDAELEARAQALVEDLASPAGAVTARVKDPLGWLEALRRRRPSALPDDAGVLLAVPRFSSGDRPQIVALMKKVDASLKARDGVSTVRTGAPAFTTEISSALERGTRTSSAIAVVVIAAVAFWLIGDGWAALLFLAALAFSAAVTLAIARLLLSPLQVLVVAAASILPAVGIDGAVHLHAHLLAHAAEPPATRAWSAARRVRSTLWLAALAAAAGFVSFTAAHAAAIRQLGVVLAIGALVNALTMAFVLPAWCTTALQRGWRPRSKREPRWPQRGRSWRLLASLIGTITCLGGALAWWVGGPARDFSTAGLNDNTLPASIGQRTVDALFPEPRAFVFSCDADVDVVLAREAAFAAEARAKGARVEAVSDIVPTTRGKEIAQTYAARLPTLQRRLQASLERAGLTEAAAREYADTLARHPADAPTAEPAFVAFERAVRLQRQPDGTTCASATAPTDAEVHALARKHGLRWADRPRLDDSLAALLQRDLERLSGLSFALVLVVIALSRWSLRRKVAAVIALFVAASWVVIGWSLAHVTLTLVSIVAVPLVVSVGIDAVLYLVGDERFGAPLPELLRPHLRSLLASTLTTLVGFASLFAIDYAPVRGLAFAVTTGLSLMLVGGVASVCAITEWSARTKSS